MMITQGIQTLVDIQLDALEKLLYHRPTSIVGWLGDVSDPEPALESWNISRSTH